MLDSIALFLEGINVQPDRTRGITTGPGLNIAQYRAFFPVLQSITRCQDLHFSDTFSCYSVI